MIIVRPCQYMTPWPMVYTKQIDKPWLSFLTPVQGEGTSGLASVQKKKGVSL